MGLFSKDHSAPVAAQPAPVTQTRTSVDSGHGHGIFSRHSRNSSASSPVSTTGHHHTVGHRDSTISSTSTTASSGRGVLSRFGGHREDPSITAASQRVLQAERAEREADAALVQARQAVKDARDHVARLEREAAEEARLAKIKQSQAADISKRAAPLGRHG